MHISAITILPINPKTGWGCKTCEVSVDLTSAHGLYSSVNSRICMNASGPDFIKCVEDEVYTSDEVIVNSPDPDSFNATSFYTSDFTGYILQSIDVKPGRMTHNLRSTLPIELNKNLSYISVFTDPKLIFLTASPLTFPRPFLKIEEVSHVQVYIQVMYQF